MAFFDDLGKKISSTSQNVMSKAKELVDISGLKSQISEEEKVLEILFKPRKAVLRYSKGESDTRAF